LAHTLNLPFRGKSAQKAAWRELCRIIRHLGSGMGARLRGMMAWRAKM
jgi:hypothetical protein